MAREQRTLVEGILQNENNEVLLMQRSDDETCPGQWQPPAGKVEYDGTPEHPAETVVREFYEENGLDVNPVDPPEGLINIDDYTLDGNNKKVDKLVDGDLDDARHSIMITYRVEPVESYNPDDIQLSDEHQAHDWVAPGDAAASDEYDLVGTFEETAQLLDQY
jgi:8-oxo-dGTP pyrophosphatase MutT (NUDIX family)